MKKVIAVVLAALFAVILPAAAVHTSDYDTRKVWMNRDEFVGCFDTVTIVGPQGSKGHRELFDADDGSANVHIGEHPLYLTDETAVICYGWSGIKGDVTTERYGYKINEGEPVFDDSFKTGAEHQVYDAGGDSRYRITVPISDNTKPTLITLVSYGSDGAVRDILEFSVNGEYELPDEHPVSPVSRVFGTVDESALTVFISGATNSFPVLPGIEFSAEIKVVNNKSVNGADLLIHYDPGLSFVSALLPLNGSSANNDPATRTIRLIWSGDTVSDDEFTLASLTFKADKDICKEFLHISADAEVSLLTKDSESLDFNIINGGADVVPYVPGDVNGDGKTGNKDVTLLFRYVSSVSFPISSVEAADCDRDGTATNKDVVKAFKISSGAEDIDISFLTAPETYDEMTNRVTNIISWTFDDGTAGNVIGVYCEAEPGAEVLVCDEDGTVFIREHALYDYFYGRFIMPEGKTTQKVYLYAKSEGKALSKNSRAFTLKYSENVGNGAIISKDSHVFLNYYTAHYNGEAALPEDHAEGRMNNIKTKLKTKLAEVRAKTGKDTKIIILVCTNPATIYHELQYSTEEKGWGDVYAPTSVTQFGEYMKDDEDIYMIDLRDILSRHKDQLLFMQADSHWTQIAAYYGYYLASQKIKKDFPSTSVYDLQKDFDVSIVPNGGDLLIFMGASGIGAKAVTASVTPKSESMKASSSAPTAYVMGDSYYGAFAPFLDLMFSNIYLNQFEYQAHPPLYCYVLDDLENKKPDYLFYIWTERNVDTYLSWLESTIVNEAS